LVYLTNYNEITSWLTKPIRRGTVVNNNIAKLRKEKGYAQKEFADMIGISHWWLNHIESGKRSPSLGLVLTIAEKLNVTPDQIFLN
jgi:DNA-binding XRE family transcriptional regulator